MKQIKQYKWVIVILFVFIALFFIDQSAAVRSTTVTANFIKEMIIVMPPVFLLMGLIDVWVPKDQIQKYLGHQSGIMGSIIAFIMGTLPTGPLYAAFPLVAQLLRKGASIKNMILFMGAWAALKIPQMMMEVSFLGLEFAVYRFVLTLLALIVMGMIMQVILNKDKEKAWLKSDLEATKKMMQKKMQAKQ